MASGCARPRVAMKWLQAGTDDRRRRTESGPRLPPAFASRRRGEVREGTLGRPSAVSVAAARRITRPSSHRHGWLIALAALVGPLAWRFARRSKLALAIALMATTVAGLGLAFGALGYGGCGQRGDCETVGGALRTVLTVAIMLLALLLLFALARVL